MRNFNSFKVYIIKCWNEEEKFYKIGKTFQPIEKRFSGNRNMPYNYEIIKIFKGTAKEVSKIERFLQKEHKNFVYLPKIKFGGQYESFQTLKSWVKKLDDLERLSYDNLVQIKDGLNTCIENIENSAK